MGESGSGDSALLVRRLWTLRLAVLPWLALVLGPMFIALKDLMQPADLAEVYANSVIPAIPLYLAMAVLCKRRPGLAAVALFGGLLLAATVVSGRNAMAYVPYIGWRPVIWAGLLALAQLMIVLFAWRAWLVAPSDGPVRYVGALAGAMAPFVIWSLLAPMHGWTGHRAHANESAALGDIRTLVSAEAIYQDSNGGFYDVPECLVAPSRCIPAYPANAPTFLDSQLAPMTAVKGGYRRVFHPGLPADPTVVHRTSASASSIQSYAYVAVPIVPGETGDRGFCGDATGRICHTRDGSAPAIENGGCAPSCENLQ